MQRFRLSTSLPTLVMFSRRQVGEAVGARLGGGLPEPLRMVRKRTERKREREGGREGGKGVCNVSIKIASQATRFQNEVSSSPNFPQVQLCFPPPPPLHAPHASARRTLTVAGRGPGARGPRAGRSRPPSRWIGAWEEEEGGAIGGEEWIG